MTNKYVEAIDARITEATLSASNISRLASVRKTLTNDKIVKLLDAAKVSEAFAAHNVYEVLKLDNLLKNALAINNLNDMNKYVLLTLFRCVAANETVTVKDCKDACSKSREVSDERKTLVVQNVKHVDEKTVNAQYNSTLNALQSLNILKHVARDSKEKHFAIDTKNAIFKALFKNMSA